MSAPETRSEYTLDWPAAWPNSQSSAMLKSQPEDFLVVELPLSEPCGEGEHVWLWIEKRGANTAFVAEELARYAAVKEMDVGFAGLKDRHAVTSQWFSIYLPKGETPDFMALEHPEFRVLRQQRHNKKLRRGDLLGNRFEIALRNFSGNRELVEQNLQAVASSGFPNYFGDQRFGHGGGNIESGIRMLKREMRVRNPKKKGLYLSAVRSWLFNQVLAERVRQGNWLQRLEGDVETDNGLPSGPQWGRGKSLVTGELEQLEHAVLAAHADILDALEHAGLQQERRTLVVKPDAMNWQWREEADNSLTLVVRFCLGAGYYATSLLKEVLTVTEPERLSQDPVASEGDDQ
ncbi:tRNA pseudouridine(13) synthase TruD [Oceanobacter mangrovi]|uniref:tRNA pseudouridine(13) synthase TruD n=1 Tax=Oceanobacter mangrovi TaxID=2862510 RepID=UPI001C8D6D93|nr:tRNA pseudouridine(13) synthase TruD [Oceanobacter mangrovi]